MSQKESIESRESFAGSGPRTIAEALPVFYRHGSPRILTSALIAAFAARAWLGHWSPWDLIPLVATAALWPLQEWLIHVFVLHFKPFALWGRTIDFRVPRKHRAHHENPWNAEILFIPMHSFVYSLPILALLWYAVTPSLSLALTGLSAYVALSLHYEWVHFLIHTRYWPRTRYYQRLWKNHRLHHFKNERYWYGVTRLEGDELLGTAPAAQEVESSPTCRTLIEAA